MENFAEALYCFASACNHFFFATLTMSLLWGVPISRITLPALGYHSGAGVKRQERNPTLNAK